MNGKCNTNTSIVQLAEYGATNEFFILNCQQSFVFQYTFIYCIASTILTYMYVHLIFLVTYGKGKM